MCGISGFIRFSDKLSKEKLDSFSISMAKKLIRRGPDSFGVWSDPKYNISLSHRRLSILDLSKKANQPMICSNDRFVIVYNGEIYNFKEIRSSFGINPKKIKTSSDTEVLLELISKKGVYRSLSILNGIFCFAVWDKKKKKLFIARDRVGVKPVYIYWDKKSHLAFASEIKALKALPWLSFEIDKKSVVNYVRLNYIPSPFSIYKNIIKLNPGSVFMMNLKKEFSIKKFFDFNYKNLQSKNFSNPSCTHLILEESVKSQMVSDVPLGVFLSGGVDSSLITALAQKNSSKKINSFTIGFEENEFDEAKYAKKISRIIGTNHNEVYFNYDSLTALIKKMPDIYDEPFADSSQLPTSLLSQITKKKVTVALSGDGGDELFGGYYRYFLAERYNNLIFNRSPIVKDSLKKIINFFPLKFWNTLGIFLPNKLGGKQFGDKLLKLSKLLDKNAETSFHQRIISNYDDFSDILYFIEENKVRYFDTKYEELVDDSTKRMQILDFLTYLPDDILTKVDRASMNYSLEVRVPFLDNKVINHAFNLKKGETVRNSNGKIILKRILAKYLPHNLINRPKMGFGVPLNKLLINNFSELMEYFLNSKKVERQQIFRVAFYRKLWEEHKSLKRNWQFLLWNFLIFQLWYEKWEKN